MVYIGNLPEFQIFMALRNFNLGVKGKILKCGIFRKRLIVERNGLKCGTGSYSVHIEGTFDARFLEFGLGCTAQNLQFLKTDSPNFYPIQTNFIQGIIIIQPVTFLAICQKLWHFEIFFNTEPYAAGIFKVLFLPQFSLGVNPNFMTTLVTMVNLNAC